MRDEYPLILGDDVTVGHEVCLHGCTIANRCLIGMGSIILNGVTIGEGSIVAAGALILERTIFRPAASSSVIPQKSNASSLASTRPASTNTRAATSPTKISTAKKPRTRTATDLGGVGSAKSVFSETEMSSSLRNSKRTCHPERSEGSQRVRPTQNRSARPRRSNRPDATRSVRGTARRRLCPSRKREGRHHHLLEKSLHPTNHALPRLLRLLHLPQRPRPTRRALHDTR